MKPAADLVLSHYDGKVVAHRRIVVNLPSGRLGTAFVHPDRKMGEPGWWEGKVVSDGGGMNATWRRTP